MKEYSDIFQKNFICYTATVQQATFQIDQDLRQAGLGLSVHSLFPRQGSGTEYGVWNEALLV